MGSVKVPWGLLGRGGGEAGQAPGLSAGAGLASRGACHIARCLTVACPHGAQ